MSEMMGRHISLTSKPLHVPTEAHPDGHTHLELSAPGSNYNSMRPQAPRVKSVSGAAPAAAGPASFSGREGVGGQTHVVHTDKPSLGERIKAAVPGTKEHKAKKEAEADLVA